MIFDPIGPIGANCVAAGGMGFFPTMNRFDVARERMIQSHLVARGISDSRVLAAMRKVPRHLFVEEAFWERAYEDHSLPIGAKQTISQPYMVGRMTEALCLKGHERVLEIGTGSGYQTAVLAELAARVFSIERIRSLAERARRIIEGLHYHNVLIRVGDGTYGLKDEGPFDAILIAAASPQIPTSLADQLKDGGVLIIPVGDRNNQVLQKGVKKRGELLLTPLTGCVFVPLLGAFGWKELGGGNGNHNHDD